MVVGITVAVGVVAETGLAVVEAIAIGFILAVAFAAAAADACWTAVCLTGAGVVEVIGLMLAIFGDSPTGRLENGNCKQIIYFK